MRIASEHGSIVLNGDEVQPGTDAGWLHEERERRQVEVVADYSINVAAAFALEDEDVEVEVWLGPAPDDDLGKPVWAGELTTERGELGVGDPGEPEEKVYVGPGRYRVDVFALPRDEASPPQHVSTHVRFVLAPLAPIR